MDSHCDSNGHLDANGNYGYRWSASPKANDGARYFGFTEDEGELGRDYRADAFPIRPVFK